MNGRRIRWNNGRKIRDDDDLCVLRAGRYWDVVHGVDGWSILAPVAIAGSAVTETGIFWLVLGDVTRDHAQRVAEDAIHGSEK